MGINSGFKGLTGNKLQTKTDRKRGNKKPHLKTLI